MNCKKLLNLLVNLITLFPQNIQMNIYEWASLDKNELIFDVLPDSVWLGYEIKNETMIHEYIPDDLELSPIKLFCFSEEMKILFFNFFKVKSKYFEGHRLEIVTTVLEKSTNKKRFIILDYFSDTISSDPKNIFKKPNSERMLLIGDKDQIIGQLDDRYNFIAGRTNRSLSLSDQFAIGCNKKIYYGWNKSHLPNILNFDEKKIKKINIIEKISVYNQLWENTRDPEPDIAFYYPRDIRFDIYPHINNTIDELDYGINDQVYESYFLFNDLL